MGFNSGFKGLKWLLGKYGMGFVQDSDRGGPREHSSEIVGFTKGV